jgi:hypothetical protein
MIGGNVDWYSMLGEDVEDEQFFLVSWLSGMVMSE